MPLKVALAITAGHRLGALEEGVVPPFQCMPGPQSIPDHTPWLWQPKTLMTQPICSCMQLQPFYASVWYGDKLLYVAVCCNILLEHLDVASSPSLEQKHLLPTKQPHLIPLS